MFGLPSVLTSDAVNARSTLSPINKLKWDSYYQKEFHLSSTIKVDYLPTKIDNFHNMKLIVYTTLAKECGMP
jgi:hypothetical protein